MDIGELDGALNALDVLRVKSKPNGDFESVVRDGVDIGMVRAEVNKVTWGSIFSSAGARVATCDDSDSLAIIGDSFAAGYLIPSNGNYSESANCYVAWALALSGRRLRIVGNFAVSGSGVSADLGGKSMLRQLDDAISSGARHLLCMGGINDAVYDQSIANVKAAWQTILNKAAAANMQIWLCTQPTMNAANGSYTIARQAQCLEQNAFLRTLTLPSLRTIDCAAAVVNPASATADCIANGTKDNLHPSNISAYFIGKEIARVWGGLVPEKKTLVSSAADVYSFSSASTNILDNGLFLAGSTTATGFTTGVTAGGLVTPTLAARSDGFGKDQILTGTFAASGDGFRMTSGDIKARISDGDVLYAECEVSASAMTNMAGLSLVLILSHAGRDEIATCAYYDPANDKAMTEGFTATFRTPSFTYDATAFGAVAYLLASVKAYGSGAGGATIKVGRMAIRKTH